MLQLIRTNPGVLVGLILLVGCALILGIVGTIMARSGASVRPILWFAGFFAMIVVPQLAWHLWSGTTTVSREAPRVEALAILANASAEPAARAEAARRLFGPDADPQLVVDSRRVFDFAPKPAEVAQFASLQDDTSVLLAQFSGYTEAEQGWVTYLRAAGLNQLAGSGDSQRGYAVSRPVGDRAYALHMGRMVGVWTGRDDNAIRARMVAGGFEVPRRAPLAGQSPAAPAAPSPEASPESTSRTRTLHPALIAALVSAYVFLVIVVFFKGAAWAGSYSPTPGVARLSAADIEARFDAIHASGVPFEVVRGDRPNEWMATWRYADARWVTFTGAHLTRRTHRVRVVLDEIHGVARATDESATFDASLWNGGASLAWKGELGITFFHRETVRVFGLQLDAHGRPLPELSYTYTFDVNELKSPLIAAVTQAGWTWRPTVWRGPTWLRWLTE